MYLSDKYTSVLLVVVPQYYQRYTSVLLVVYLSIIHCNDEVERSISSVDYLVVLVLHEGTLMVVERGEARSAHKLIYARDVCSNYLSIQSQVIHPKVCMHVVSSRRN